MIAPDADPGFALYVHWPFCASKCPYCDFNSHVAEAIDQGAWRTALCHEVRRSAAETPGACLGSIFFGGGTPSTMPPETVGEVIATARAAWRTTNDLEITLEANPTSSDAARFAAFRDAGANRISIGVQALRDPALRALGRRHSAAEARAAIAAAAHHFERVSADLIYARQDQTKVEWEVELREAIDLGTSHLSLYQLTIEEGTAFAARAARGLLSGLPDEDLAAALYEVTQEICARHGLGGYEISNHARDGDACRHNLVYWRGGEWVGIGPGAHGRLGPATGRVATRAVRNPTAWLQAVQAVGTGEEPREPIPPAEVGREYLLMALRLREGASIARMRSADPGLAPDRVIADLVDRGLLLHERDRICATDAGRLVLNGLVRALDAG
jgi:oxygen-independent coproporphyrinogen-3 oxidase